MSGVSLIEVGPDEAGLRLDRWFRRRYPDLPHTGLQKLLRTGQIRIDGRRAKAGLRLEPGQIVRVPPLGVAERRHAKPKPKPVRSPDQAEVDDLLASVLYRDDHVIVINKPPGLAVQGGSKVSFHLDAMLGALQFDFDQRPKLVHRIDKDTSGVLVLGRTASAAAMLANSFRSREALKLYWAVVVGVPRPSAGCVDLALSRQSGQAGERTGPDKEDGKHAVTDYRVIEKAGKKISWLALRPRTGRTHQLRAHCLALSTPILGDGKFGGRGSFVSGFSSRLHLHARAIRIPHPKGGLLDITAPMPSHMLETMKRLEFEEKSARAGFNLFQPY